MNLFVRILIFAALISPAGAAAPFSPAPYMGVIDSGIVLTVEQEYPRVITLFSRQPEKEGAGPLFAYFQLLAYESMMIDYETQEWEKTFDSLYERSESGFRRLLAKEPKNPWVHYFLGNLYVTHAVHVLRFSNYLNFTQQVFKGLNHLEKAVGLDSTLQDAYLYMSLYQFAKTKLFHYLPLLEDDPQEAYDHMERLRQHSLFSKELASQILVAVYCHEGEWEKAEAIARDFKARFPGTRSIYWVMANGYLAKKEYGKAQAEFDSLAVRVEKIPPQYVYNRLAVKAGLARIAYETGRYGECAGLCDKILALHPNDARTRDFAHAAEKLKVKSRKKAAAGAP